MAAAPAVASLPLFREFLTAASRLMGPGRTRKKPVNGRCLIRPRVSAAGNRTLAARANGVIIARYPISLRQISDGTSKTYLLGEKFIEIDHYESGWSISDDQNAYVGFDRDNQVSSRFRPLGDTSSSQMAQAINAAGEEYGFHFGSAIRGLLCGQMRRLGAYGGKRCGPGRPSRGRQPG